MALQQALSRYFEDRGNFGPEDFLHAYGDPRQALLAFRVFWPELTFVREHVVLSTFVDTDDAMAKLIQSLERKDAPVQEVLSGYRWEEVDHMFSASTIVDDDYRVLAELMARTWLGALYQFAPAARWATWVMPPQETGGAWGVSFREEAPAAS